MFLQVKTKILKRTFYTDVQSMNENVKKKLMGILKNKIDVDLY